MLYFRDYQIKFPYMKKTVLSLLIMLSAMHMKSQDKFLDPANIDPNTKVGDDFYQHFNGTWLKENPVPEDQVRWGSFLMLRDRTLDNQKEILTELENNTYTRGSIEDQVRSYYLSGMDVDSRNDLGTKPIDNLLEKYSKARSNGELLGHVLDNYKNGLGYGFSFYIGVDDKDVTKYIPTFSQSGLGLPDRDYYFKEGENFEKIREKYRSYIKDMLTFIESEEEARADANKIYNLEVQLADHSMDKVDRRNPENTYHKFTREDFQGEFDFFYWDEVMSRLGVPVYKEVLVSQPEFYRYWGELWKDDSKLETLKAYYRFHLLSDMAEYLSEEIEQQHFSFYGTTLSGQEKPKAQWKRVLSTINGSAGELMGQLYVKKFFTAEAKEKMVVLVDNLQEAYAKRIKQLPWMSSTTKEQALNKLHSITKKIGYPDKWKDYSMLKFDEKNYAKNVMNAYKLEYQRNIIKYGNPVDKSEWYMSPQTVNAYYNPAFNEIVFPAAILAFPFFDPDADDAVNYGGIGAVIGHEMTHGFDDQGAKYAADGNLKNWWTTEDEKAFQQLTSKLVKQFDNFRVLDTVAVNGKLTLGENIADLGGVAIAYDAYMNTPEAKAGKSIDGYTPSQRFFMSWAQIWRNNIRPEAAMRYIMTDPHSPGKWRCNGPLTNTDAWYDAFDVHKKDNMYVSKKERIKIW